MSLSSPIVDKIIIIASEQSDMPATLESRLVEDLKLDSLDMLSMSQAIEEAFGLQGQFDQDFPMAETVADVVRIVEERLGQKAAPIGQ